MEEKNNSKVNLKNQLEINEEKNLENNSDPVYNKIFKEMLHLENARTNKDLKNFLEKSELNREIIERGSVKNLNKIIIKNVNLISVFKFSIIFYLFFFTFILFLGIIVYLLGKLTGLLPSSNTLISLINGSGLGFLNYYNNPAITGIFFVIFGYVLSVAAGLIGVLCGWISNLTFRFSGGIEYKFLANTYRAESRAGKALKTSEKITT